MPFNPTQMCLGSAPRGPASSRSAGIGTSVVQRVVGEDTR